MHATSVRLLCDALNANGKSDHVDPFQRSTSAVLPTAKHAVASGQSTLTTWKKGEFAGLPTIDHVAPFQCSSNAALWPPPDNEKESPTAEQSVAPEQATEMSSASAPAGDGVGTIDHVVPFHCSASGLALSMFGSSGLPDPVYELPTAKHAEALVHATPLNPAPSWPAGNGVASIDHAPPVERSTSGRVAVFVRY